MSARGHPMSELQRVDEAHDGRVGETPKERSCEASNGRFDETLDVPFRTAPFGALWACYFGSIGLFNPYSPLWLAHLGHSTLVIGAFSALQSWTRIVAPYGWGWLADHGGRRITLLRAAALASLGAAAALWLLRDAGAWALAAVVAALFLANGAFTPIAETLILRHLHAGGSLDARRYGRVRLWGSVGFIASVLLFGVLLQRFGIAALPLFTFGMVALLAWATWRLPRSVEPPAEAAPRAAIGPVLRRPVVRWFFAAMMLTVLAHSSLYAFFSLFLDERGYGKAAVGLMWAVSVAAEIVFFALAGRFFGRIDPHRWLLWAALATAARFALTAAFGDVPAVLGLLQLTHALTFAAQHMACTSLIALYFPDQLRARGSALYSTLGYGVPGVVGGLAGGWLSQAAGLASVFWAAALAGLAAAGCCVVSMRAHNQAAARLMSRGDVKAPPADVP
jgi:MFS transporter, PPP family, 3-phenylpropionic acid transporter